ncbi:SPFH domain-containing protein [Desulfonema magnum]|uniref:SPFH domain-containing protein n=1 Tax=Desulfonema magnum TaxID=45655 RepID=A0A975GU11_9BACT|nr:prohibitin family protein [Desulfonema magnum]QTA93675.1 SPFH domain-containing protein [Desulfonema magnum]
MNLDSLLHLITILAWSLFAAIEIILFTRNARKHGFKIAFNALLSWRKIVMPLCLLISLSIFSASLVFIEPQSIGVVISAVSSNGIRPRPVQSGLRWIIPLAEELIIYPLYWQTYTMSGKPLEGEKPGDDSISARTADGQEVILDSSIIFRINPEKVVQLHINWQDRYIRDFIRPAVRGVIRITVSKYTVDEVNSDRRGDVETELYKQLKIILSFNSLIMEDFLVRNIAFTSQYAASVEQKQVAGQKETEKIYEARQIENLAAGQANKIRIRAKAEADAILITADAEAKARLLQAKAEAEAFKLIAVALAQNPDLLTYQYIRKLSPNIKSLYVPNDAYLTLPEPALTSEVSGHALNSSETAREYADQIKADENKSSDTLSNTNKRKGQPGVRLFRLNLR